MSRFDRKQQNSVKQLSFNKKIKRKKFYRLIAPLPLSCFFLCLFFTKIQNKKHAAATAQSCPTLCDPMTIARQAPLSREFSRWGLERVAISFSRGSSPPRDRTCVSCIAGRFFTKVWLTLPVCVAILSLLISLPFRRLANFAFSSVKNNDQQRLLECRRPSQERGGTQTSLWLPQACTMGRHLLTDFSGYSGPECSIRCLMNILEAGR